MSNYHFWHLIPILPWSSTQNTDEQITTNKQKNNEKLHAIDMCVSLLLYSKYFRIYFGNYLKIQLFQRATKLNSRNDNDTDIANIFVSIFNEFNCQLKSNLKN